MATYIRICQILKEITLRTLWYPCFTQDYIRENIIDEKTRLDEQKEYLSTSSERPFTPVVFMIFYVLYIIKHYLYLNYMIRAFDQNILTLDSSASTHLARGDVKRRIACLETNCSRLGADPNSSIDSELGELPLFSLCQPSIVNYYTPLVHLNSISMLIHSIVILIVIISGIVFPLIQRKHPTENFIFMFVLAPQVTLRNMKKRANALFDQLSYSHRNYLANLDQIIEVTSLKLRDRSNTIGCNTNHIRGSSAYITEIDSTPMATVKLFADKSHYQYFSDAISRAEANPVTKRDFVFDCLPLARTEVWRSQLSRSFVYSISTIGFVMMAFATVVFSMIAQYNHDLKKKLAGYSEHMHASNCSIWYSNAGKIKPPTEIDLMRFEFGWTWWALTETPIYIATPALLIAIMLGHYYVINCDLAFWLAELRNTITFAHELSRLTEKEDDPLPKPLNYQSRPKSDVSPLAPMREKLIEAHKEQKFMLSHLCPKRVKRIALVGEKLEAKIIYQELALRVIKAEGPDRADALLVEVNEKLYLNFRLFYETVKQQSMNIADVIVVAGGIVIGLAILSVYFSVKLHDFRVEPILFIICVLLITNALISIGSNFHANARKMQVSLWSLTAQKCYDRNLDMQHMRRLWLKIVFVLDREGGLALTAFSFRVTYMNIVQLLVWTTTILLFAFRR